MGAFHAGLERYDGNHHRAESLRVVQAKIRTPEGEVQGVAIFAGNLLQCVLQPHQAFSLANEIADVLEDSK